MLRILETGNSSGLNIYRLRKVPAKPEGAWDVQPTGDKQMSDRHMKVVRLLEPEMCLNCRFAQIADVETASGGKQRMIYCRRLDCDNWDMTSAEMATDVQVREDEAA